MAKTTEDFLTAEPQSVIPGPSRKRGPMSIEQREKIKASPRARRERQEAKLKSLKPESAPDLKTGLTKEDTEELRREVRLQAAEARIKEAALSEDTQRLMVHQEVKVDSCNTLRRHVELTPSMCRARNCPWDAAKEAGATDWNNAPIDQPMSDDRTFGERLITMREYH